MANKSKDEARTNIVVQFCLDADVHQDLKSYATQYHKGKLSIAGRHLLKRALNESSVA